MTAIDKQAVLRKLRRMDREARNCRDRHKYGTRLQWHDQGRVAALSSVIAHIQSMKPAQVKR